MARNKKSSLYMKWDSMKNRCYNVNNKRFADYGGRGITVCSEWINSFSSFKDWAMCNGWENGLQIDRIDNNSGYRPNNCRFATAKENCRNRRSNVVVSYNGEAKTVVEWAEALGINYHTLQSRLVRRQWDVKRALETPVSGGANA